MKNLKKTCLLTFAVVIFAGLILDLVVKHFIVGIDLTVISGVLSFVYSKNTGAAWGIFSGGTIALSVVTALAVVLFLIYAIFSKTNSKLFHISLGLIVSGALGNLFDRVFFGYVRDFIKLDFINFPIFNIADMLLTFGIICLFVFYIIEAVKEFKKKKENR